MRQISHVRTKRRSKRRSERDRGTSFIELLVSVVLLGTAGIAVMTALATSIRGSDTHRNVADTQSWLASAGDVLTDVPPQARDNYLDCAANSAADIVAGYQKVVSGLPGAVSVSRVEFWDSTGSGAFGSTCRYAAGDRLQRISLTATTDGVTKTLAVVKRPALDQTVNTLAPPTTLGGGNVDPEPNPYLNP